jgi:hypothetical protein
VQQGNKQKSDRDPSREALIKRHIVIPAKAGIQKNQGTGHRLSPV